MIELDALLFGECTPAEASEFFKSGEFYGESYLVMAIKRHLITPEHKQKLFDMDLSIEDLLNGRFTGDEESEVLRIFADWNTKLGFEHFKF